MKLRVLQVISTLDRSGAEKQLTLLACGLPREQFDVRVVALTRSGPYAQTLQANGIPLTVLGKRARFDPLTLLKLRRQIRQFQPDVVHSWLFSANAYARLALPRGDRPRMLVGERCVDTWKAGWQFTLDKKLQSRTDGWAVNSQAVADFYRERDVPEERLHVIRNGVEQVEQQPLPADAEQRLRTELDVPADARIVLSIGRLAAQKRLRDLIWAMQLLRQLTDRVFFVIVGDGPERERLEHYAQRMTCDHVTRFVGQRSDTAELLRLADVFWLASEFEGQSNSLLEAMAAGLPVVVSDIPPNRELVTAGKTGMIAGVGDSPAYAQWTDRLLADPEWTRQLGTAARQFVQQNFAVSSMIASYAELYRSLTSADANATEPALTKRVV